MWLQSQAELLEKNACMQVCVGVRREARSKKQEILRSCRGDTPSNHASLWTMHQIVTSPSCSEISFTFGSSSADSSLFPPAAAAKLNVERMLDAEACPTRGEGGSETSPLRVKGGDRGAPLRSPPWRELLRDIGCWPMRSLVASRSLSRRSAMAFSLAVTSTGLKPKDLSAYEKRVWGGYTNLAAPKGLGRLAGLLWAILGEESGDGIVEVVPERGRSSNFRRVSWGVGGVDEVAILPSK